MVVGGGVDDMPGEGDFKISLLIQVVHDNLGPWGEGFFGLGFIAASLSSMLAAPVGAAWTIQSVWGREDKKLPRPWYFTIMFTMTVFATLLIGSGVGRENIIMVCQVSNGCLLPFFSACLLICLNDPQFMRTSPQKGWANMALIIAVSVTIFLTYNNLSSKMPRLAMGAVISIGGMLVLLLGTPEGLGREVLNSFRQDFTNLKKTFEKLTKTTKDYKNPEPNVTETEEVSERTPLLLV